VPPRVEPILPTLPLPPSSTRRVTPSVVHGLASPSDATSGPIEEAKPPAADVGLLLGSAEEENPRLPFDNTVDEGAASSSILFPPKIPVPSLASAVDAAPSQGLLPHSTALQEELSAQLAQMAGQLRRNAEHFSTALAADQAVLRGAEEKIGANYDVMKRERVRLRDHRGKSLGTTCLTITSVLVVAVAFLVMFFLLRFT
jgi:Membrane fusion protein Use1